jgi:hypothetical protein
VLVFRLGRPAKLLVTVYGPGPSCNRLGTFSRRGQLGVNRVPFSGSLFGRPLAPGRYAIVVEAWRGGKRVWMGRVLVVILARDGREGGNRPLAAPDCDGNAATVTFLASGGGDFSQLASISSGSSGDEAELAAAGGSGSDNTGGVAGVSAGNDDGLPLLPALPAIPSIPVDDPYEGLAWTFLALAVGGTLGAAAFFLATGLRRRRDRAAWH